MLNQVYQFLDPVAFSIGPVDVRWYGIAYVLGFICCSLVMYRTARRWGVALDHDAMLTIVASVMIGVIFGARLAYVLIYGEGRFLSDPLSVFALNEGGMSFHGGLAGALIAGYVASRLVGVPYLTLIDLGCIAAPIGLLLGRCANFVNGELWGAPTDASWGVVFGGAAGLVPRHPTQLYEAMLEGVLLFVVLYALSRRNPPLPRGSFTGVFLLLYGICRFLIEFVREPDIQLGYLAGGWLTMGQVLSVPLVIAGVAMIIYAWTKRVPQVAREGASD